MNCETDVDKEDEEEEEFFLIETLERYFNKKKVQAQKTLKF